MERWNIKPKLAFFQYRYDQSLPEFLLLQKKEHVKCLAQFFDVTVINHDCDYQKVCDTARPDLTLVESGVSYSSCIKLKVTNTRACPEIPKLGLMNSDAFCFTREGFASDMAQWGIDTAFSIATTAPEHNPTIVEHLFVWPVFVDDEIYQDYGLWKTIPILFTGNANSLYPWRQRIAGLVSKYYPSLICPHPGYTPRHKRPRVQIQFMAGEAYAKTLNASRFVFACGTVAKDAVRKHFEIPAAKACLVTEKSAVLEAAGFVDMKNCVFADHNDVLDKLDFLFTHPEELAEITEAGYQLVRSHHTIKHRDQIRQWYDLQRNLTAGNVIAQPNPFHPLRIMDRGVAKHLPPIASNGEHLRLLREGDEKLMAGNYNEAENLYARCWNYIPWMPEPKVRMAICHLFKGNAKNALHWISQPLQFTLTHYKADEPDPVEWAYFIITLLCQGRIGEAAQRIAQFNSLQQLDLIRLRSAIGIITNAGDDDLAESMLLKQRASIHRLPMRDFKEWKRHLCQMLNACGQQSTADKLRAWTPKEINQSRSPEHSNKTARPELPSNVDPSIGYTQTAWQNDPRFGGKRSLRRSVKRKCKRAAGFLLSSLEDRFGYFFPYHLSCARQDDFYSCVERIAEQDEVKSVLILGADNKRYTTQALHAGIRRNTNEVAIFCLVTGSDDTQCGPAIERFKREKNVDSFDLVLIDLSEFRHLRKHRVRMDRYCLEARFVAMEGISEISKYPEYHEFMSNSRYVPLVSDPVLRKGYAIFERRAWVPYGAQREQDIHGVLYAGD